MSQFDRDPSKYLSSEERDAMRLAARGNAVLEVVALLEALGVEETAIEKAVQVTRERTADMPVDVLQGLGGRAVSMVQLLDGEPLDTVESEEGELPVYATKREFVPGPMRRVNPAGTYKLVESVTSPVGETERQATTVNPYIHKVFGGIFSFDELKAIETMEPARRAVFVDRLMEVYREVSHKPEYAAVHGQRLGLMLEGRRVKEIRELLDTPDATIHFTFNSLGQMFERHPSGAREAYAAAIYEEIDTEVVPVAVSETIVPIRVDKKVQPEPSGERQTTTHQHIKAVFGSILSDEDMLCIEQLEPHQRDLFTGLLTDIYRKVSKYPERGEVQVARFRRMLDGLRTVDIAREQGCSEVNIQQSRRSMRQMMGRLPDDVIAALVTAKGTLLPADDETVAPTDSATSPEPMPSENHEQDVPVDSLIDETLFSLMEQFDFGYSDVKGLVDRLKGISNRTDSGLVTANIALLTAAREVEDMLDQTALLLLRAHLTPRPGRPPLSPSEIVERVKDTPGFDIETVQRSIVGALAKIKEARS